MKKITLIIVCLISFTEVWSQQSEQWFYEGKQWAKLTWKFCPETELTITNLIQGSVEIEGLTYWKVFEAWKEDLSDLTFSGYYLREADNKVYWYDPDTKEEDLYMDFNLKQGDVFHHIKFDDIKLCAVAVGDTILPQGDGVSRKYMKIGFPGEDRVEDIWVEGIGSLTFGIGALCVGCTGANNELLCCHDTKKSFYMNGRYNTCFRKILSQWLLLWGKQWAVWSPSATNPSDGTTVTSVIKNTKIINDKSYHEVWNSTNEDLSDMKFAYYMREDVYSRKVYVYNERLNKEYLWFDFDLKVGDKFSFYTGDPKMEATATVVAITDTIFPNGGDVKRKCIHLEPSYFGIMVESIGSLSYGIGEFNPSLIGSSGNELLCYHAENGDLVYQSEIGTCYKSTGLPENRLDDLSVQCPEKGMIHFSWGESSSFTVLTLYAEDGTLVRQKSIPSGEFQLSICNLPQATYFYALTTLQNKRSNGKVYVK